MNAKPRPCPALLPDMSEKQKKSTRARWRSHLHAWILEHDPTFLDNITNLTNRVQRGQSTIREYASARSTLEERSVRRGLSSMERDLAAYNNCVMDWWAIELTDAKRYGEGAVLA